MPFLATDNETGLPVIIRFGEMDIGLAPAFRPYSGHGVLGVSWMDKPQPEEVTFKEPIPLSDLEPLVILEFPTLASLETMIRSLEKLRPAFAIKENKIVRRLKNAWHNIVLHPLAGVCWLCGWQKGGDWIHGK